MLIEKNTELYACFVDFEKAFAFFRKLLNKGIGGNFYRIIEHVYSTILCCDTIK